MAATGIKLPDGDDQNLSEAVYRELRRRAQWFLNCERPGHTLQPTEIVHEVWLRLAAADKGLMVDRAHFLATAGRIMRHILCDYARARNADRRGGNMQRIDLDQVFLFSADNLPDVLIIDEALKRLAAWDERVAKLVELRFFGGLTEQEIATALNISERTVKRDWKLGKSWLRTQLDERQEVEADKKDE